MPLLRYAESYTRTMQPWVARTAGLLMLGIIAVIPLTKGEVVLANGLKPIIVSLIVILASFLLGWGMLFLTKRARENARLLGSRAWFETWLCPINRNGVL